MQRLENEQQQVKIAIIEEAIPRFQTLFTQLKTPKGLLPWSRLPIFFGFQDGRVPFENATLDEFNRIVQADLVAFAEGKVALTKIFQPLTLMVEGKAVSDGGLNWDWAVELFYYLVTQGSVRYIYMKNGKTGSPALKIVPQQQEKSTEGDETPERRTYLALTAELSAARRQRAEAIEAREVLQAQYEMAVDERDDVTARLREVLVEMAKMRARVTELEKYVEERDMDAEVFPDESEGFNEAPRDLEADTTFKLLERLNRLPRSEQQRDILIHFLVHQESFYNMCESLGLTGRQLLVLIIEMFREPWPGEQDSLPQSLGPALRRKRRGRKSTKPKKNRSRYWE